MSAARRSAHGAQSTDTERRSTARGCQYGEEARAEASAALRGRPARGLAGEAEPRGGERSRRGGEARGRRGRRGPFL